MELLYRKWDNFIIKYYFVLSEIFNIRDELYVVKLLIKVVLCKFLIFYVIIIKFFDCFL